MAAAANLHHATGHDLNAEPGYISQWVNRSARDRIEHIANLTVAAKF